MDARPARHHPWMPLMLLAFLLPAIFLLFYFQIATNTFRLLGLSPTGALLLLLASVVGSTINIPLTRRRIVLADPAMEQMPAMYRRLVPMFHYYPPAVTEEIVAVNVGGALVPIIFSIYLLAQATTSIVSALIATTIVAVVAKLLARPLPGVGITLPGFIPPLLAAIASYAVVHFFAMGGALAPVAYIAGALGTLIGADLLNLPLVLRGGLLNAGPQRLWRVNPEAQKPPTQPRILSIGGAGIFDGIFLTAIIAPFLAGIR